MSFETAIRVESLGKCYQIYARPQDRLKQAVLSKIHRLVAPLGKFLTLQMPSPGPYFRDFWALKDISLEVKRGETVGIIGRNGAGKSTLLQLIAGTIAPTTGSIAVNGRVAALLELGSGFNPEFVGRENVFLNGALLGISRKEMERRFEDIAAFADIGDFIDQPVKIYSNGMLMRLAFAVSIHVDPDILIVDEALAVGDMAFQFKCLERLRRLVSSGKTLLFVSHDIALVKAFCQKAIYLANGSIRAHGLAEEVVEHYLLDARNEHRGLSANTPPLFVKQPIADSGRIAFGTSEGSIITAEFADTRSTRAAYKTDEEVVIHIETEFLGSVTNPAVSVILQDRKLIPIFGRSYTLCNKAPANGASQSSIRCSFRASLAEGSYFVTIRLEDRQTDRVFLIIDKQVGVLTFDVVGGIGVGYLGVVRHEIDFVEDSPK